MPSTAVRIVYGLASLAVGTSAATLPAVRARDASSRPLYTPLEDVAQNCVQWWNSDDGYSCTVMLLLTGVSENDFIEWNPSITPGCDNFLADTSYCIEVGEPTSEAPVTNPTTGGATDLPATSATPSSSTGANGIETPTPIQPGMVDDCDDFHLVEKDEGCEAIASQYGISLDEFLTWNPEVGGKSCNRVWADAYVCVSAVGSEPSPTKPDNGIETPTPIQAGMTPDCKKFHLVEPSQGCYDIVALYHISVDIFIRWNPSAGKDCTDLWANTYACVGT